MRLATTFSFGRRSVVALWAFVLFVQSAGATFSDTETSWFGYRDAVEFLEERGVVQGYPDGTFRPKQAINRAEFLTLVFREHAMRKPVGGSCFSDVSAEAWYAPYVCTAARRGIVSGYPDGTYAPERTVNMAEAMKILQRVHGDEFEETPGEHWYEPYVEAFDEKHILPRHSFLPWQELNRERAADLIARHTRYVENKLVPSRSEGCGKAAPATPPSSVEVYGTARSFLLTVPREYLSHEPAPLIIAFHGRTNGNDQVRAYYGLDKAAAGYFVAYPAGMPAAGGGFSWADAGNPADTPRDLKLFDEMVRKLAGAYCIDMERIYVVGHSLGGWFANTVACLRADVVRASATVGGSSTVKKCAGPVASLIINNPLDASSSHEAAENMRDVRAEANHCLWQSVPAEPASLNCAAREGCYGGNPVLFCPHTINTDHRGEYYPHVWPRETGAAIVKFFEALP